MKCSLFCYHKYENEPAGGAAGEDKSGEGAVGEKKISRLEEGIIFDTIVSKNEKERYQ